MTCRSGSVFRIDKFHVPSASRAEFLSKLQESHALLDSVDGCVQNYILEQTSGAGRFNIVTFVEWRDQEAYEVARSAAQARHRASGFEPQTMFEQLSIGADIANYAVVPHA